LSKTINIIERVTGKPVRESTSLGGGCIADTKKITLDSGEVLCAKTGGTGEMFPCEAEGLKELGKPNVIRVPKVVHVDSDLLVLEYIHSAKPSNGFFELFGERLAALHRYSQNYFGFEHDNLIGASNQKNTPKLEYTADKHQWPEFYFTYRILYQLELAQNSGRGTKELTSLVAKLEHRIHDILATSPEPPSLLHGDLWSGNFMADDKGEPCIIDPAVYYGHREAELGMTRLFGGFSSEFYRAYDRAFPLESGHEERGDFYKLYHLLNHFNLFGGGYYSESISILKRYL